MGRGAFIVFEGGDRCGKSTQCAKLVEALKKEGKPVEFIHFPDRTTPIGKLIDGYLGRSDDVDDHAIHLLFVANRWEAEKKLHEKLMSGITLVVDRYSYSGAAFSAAKDKCGLNLDWCMQPEKGLPKPDAVVFLNLPPSSAALRTSFGSERYENVKFQNKVIENFNKLQNSNWMVFDAAKNIDDLHQEIKTAVEKILCNIEPIIELI